MVVNLPQYYSHPHGKWYPNQLVQTGSSSLLLNAISCVVQSAAFLAFQAEHNTETYIVVLGTSAIALTYNVVHSIMIQQTSAVTTTVIGQAKIIGLLILSALLLGGVSWTSFFEFLVYNLSQHYDTYKSKPAMSTEM